MLSQSLTLSLLTVFFLVYFVEVLKMQLPTRRILVSGIALVVRTDCISFHSVFINFVIHNVYNVQTHYYNEIAISLDR